MTAELLAKVDEGKLCGFDVRELRDQGADLQQGLAHALSAGQPGAVLVLAHEFGVRLDEGGEAVAQATPDEELLTMASRGNWATVAYIASLDCDNLSRRLRAIDTAARRDLRRAAGGVRVELPRDLREAYAKTGSIGHELNVEHHRWLLPRPRPEQRFTRVDGLKLEEGWYNVVHYPLSDDFRLALLRRRPWQASQREKAAHLLKSTGETLFCKAVKDEQWELVEWMLAQGDAPELTKQLEAEFGSVWDNEECRITLHTHQDLEELNRCLGDDGMLQRPLSRKRLAVPAGARVLSPSLDALREAEALGPRSLEALHRIGCTSVALVVPQPQGSRRRWLDDLAALGEGPLARPLVHRAVHTGRLELLRRLLGAVADVDACNAQGRSALAVATTAGRWDAAAELLRDGCRADGRNGMLALAAAQQACRPGSGCSPEEADKARALLDAIYQRQLRAPSATLADFFKRQVRGEITNGIEPRRFELCGQELCSRTTQLRIWVRALVIDGHAGEHDVLFAKMDPQLYGPGSRPLESLDLATLKLVTEDALFAHSVALAVAVAVPPSRLSTPARDGSQSVLAGVSSKLVGKLPIVARAPPCGSLRVSGTAACCGVSIGRIEIVVNGSKVGETPELGPGSDEGSELTVQLPMAELEVSLELSGQRLRQERLFCSPDSEMLVEVPVSVFIYIQPLEGMDQDFVFICGHRRDVPLDEGARAFVGEVCWDCGSTQLSTLEPLVLGARDCLARLRSLVLRPKLPAGRSFEAVEWEDTGTCQFQRCIVNPVRVGKIFAG